MTNIDLYDQILIMIESFKFFEGESLLKNPHLLTHLKLHDNKDLFLCMQNQIHIYSLPKMIKYLPSLINIIDLHQILNTFQQVGYADDITSMFRGEKDLSISVYDEQQKNNLMKIDNIKKRINFLNSSKARVKNIEFFGKNMAVLFHDGRCLLLVNMEESWEKNQCRIEPICMNHVIKEEILEITITNQKLLLICQSKIFIYDLTTKQKISSFKITSQPNFNGAFADEPSKDKLRIYLIYPKKIEVTQIHKKKQTHLTTITLPTFITKTYNYKQQIYITLPNHIYQINKSNLEQLCKHREYEQPIEFLYVDCMGNEYMENQEMNQQLFMVDGSTNGVLVGVTIRKGGSYKEGRIVIKEKSFEAYLQTISHHIKTNNTPINIKDSILIIKTKQVKQKLSEISVLYKTKSPSIQFPQMTPSQLTTLNVLIGHAFQGKQSVIQNVIKKELKHKFESIGKQLRKADLDVIHYRCCFTGKVLLDEDLVMCCDCKLYGIFGEGQICVVCLQQMKSI